MVKVKSCANRSIEDAKMSLDAKADIIGILVGQEHNSIDFVDKYKAKEINDFVEGRCDVDVNSGCKNEKGVKDAEKVKKFVYNAKNI